MLHAAFAASPYQHARIVSVDTSAAKAVAGVRAVLTGADVQKVRFGRRLLDWPVLAWERALFIGDRVAAVAADTLDAAEEAARLIEVTYQELPAVLDPESALSKDAPILHPERGSYVTLGQRGAAIRDPATFAHANVQGHEIHEHGDVAASFERAAAVFEHEFIVPRAAMVWLEGDLVHAVTTNKAPFALREQMAATIGLPQERIVIHTAHVGRDFGGKGLSLYEFVLYFLTRATGRPVRSLLRYADELQISNTRHAA